MAVTYSTFVIRFPEFATADPDEQSRITTFINDAVLDVNEDAWGTKTDLGVSYLAAHRLAVANRTKDIATTSAEVGSGAVVEARSKNLSVRFSDPASGVKNFSNIGLASTPYGLQYAELRSTLSITPLTA